MHYRIDDKVIRDMKTQIEKALNILKGHDFYWFMADFAYTDGTRDNAKASMKYFVKVVSQIDNKNIREALRNLWTLYYDEARARVNGRDIENFNGKEEELMSILAVA